MNTPRLHLSESVAALLTIFFRIGMACFAIFCMIKLFAWGVAWPFFFGWILAYMYRPLVVRLTHLSIPRIGAAFVPFFLTYLVLIVFFLFFPDYLLKISAHLSHSFKDYYDVSIFRKEAGYLYSRIKTMDPRIGDILYQAISTTAHHAVSIVSSLVQGSLSMVQKGLTVLFVPLIGFYFAKDWVKIGNRFYKLCPTPYRAFLKATLTDMKTVLGYYLHGQMLVALILSFYYVMTLSIAGVHGSILIGCISGLLIFIPYAGPFFGFFVSCGTVIVQKSDLENVLAIAGIYIVGSLLESTFLTPFFLGKKIGIHSLWIFFFAYLGFSLGGALGVFASLPLACIASVLCKILYGYYVQTDFFHRGFSLPLKK